MVLKDRKHNYLYINLSVGSFNNSNVLKSTDATTIQKIEDTTSGSIDTKEDNELEKKIKIASIDK